MFSTNASQVSTAANYIEDVFSTYLYTGNGSTQTITNGIDLAGKGGLVWIKDRTNPIDNVLFDTLRGVGNGPLVSNSISAGGIYAQTLTAFNTNGFSVTLPGSGILVAGTNRNNPDNYASWTFRKQPKFFDVVTFTATRSGSGWSGGPVVVNHNLGSTPGCIMWKATTTTSNWYVHHRSLGNQYRTFLNTIDASVDTGITNYINPTSTNITFSDATAGIVSDGVTVTIVAYLFAHNAGGFGASGSDNVISCGLCTANGSGDFSATLGYEPQWVLMKSTGSGRWSMVDNMRGATASSGYTSSKRLQPQAVDAEDQLDNPYGIGFNATGFTGNLATFSNDFIYIAIRRGPMKVPTSGTSVFAPLITNGATRPGFVTDLQLANQRAGDAYNTQVADRLRGGTKGLVTSSSAVEYTGGDQGFDTNNGTNYTFWTSSYVRYSFQRAPGFFDEVCYTGTYLAPQAHNLGVAPELVIFKNRTTAGMNWIVKSYPILGNSQALVLNSTAAAGIPSGLPTPPFASSPDTATIFYSQNVAIQEYNFATDKYVAYLFATCPGVSKVGSYTGTGATQIISCGFTGGARFVLIKRTDSTGDWYVWDTARGMVSGTDPSLLLNSNAVEVNANSIYTTTGGFQIVSTAAGINASGGTFIFLAIA
jgi:hypothetical protein